MRTTTISCFGRSKAVLGAFLLVHKLPDLVSLASVPCSLLAAATVLLWDVERAACTSAESPDLNTPLPQRTFLLPVYPNPSNLGVLISYELAREGRVTIRVYDTSGRVVRTLDLGVKPPGRHIAYWDGRGREVGSGVYIYSLRTGDFFSDRRMAVVK